VTLIQAQIKQAGSIILIPPTSTKMRNLLRFGVRFTFAGALAYPRVPYQRASANYRVILESFGKMLSHCASSHQSIPTSDFAADGSQQIADLAGVIGVIGEDEIGFERVDRLAETVGLHTEHAQIT
jgi:hypothetical protein